MKLIAGLILAAISSLCFAGSYFGQHRGVSDLEPLSSRHPIQSMHLLLGNRDWLLGYVSGWGGWGIYIGALALAPLSIVQALSAAVIGILALIARRTDHPTSQHERMAVILATIGVLFVLVTARSSLHHTRPSSDEVLIFVGAALACALVIFIALPKHLRGVAFGIASGLCYGAGDVATKAAVLGEPLLVPVFLACAGLGFIALQLAYQRASLLASAGLSLLLTNSIPVVAGILIFGELPPHGIATWARDIGFAMVILGVVGLAGDSAAVAR